MIRSLPPLLNFEGQYLEKTVISVSTLCFLNLNIELLLIEGKSSDADRSKVLMWSLLVFFGVYVSVMFHFMFVHYTFSSVWVAEWPPFGK